MIESLKIDSFKVFGIVDGKRSLIQVSARSGGRPGEGLWGAGDAISVGVYQAQGDFFPVSTPIVMIHKALGEFFIQLK